jgi:CheY-like chemotaxis protein/anti-sigma regulatory factor (Ser/Thr protein kinase)
MSPQQTPKKRVLVVDADRALRHVIVALLKSAGYSVDAAHDRASVLTQIREQPFDLIILDPSHPRVGGLDLLTAIQKLESPPRVLILTADDTPHSILQAIRENAHQYIVKPAPPHAIVESVERVLAAVKTRPIEVVSARPDWVELLAPCDLETAERIQTVLEKLEADLPQDVRDSIGAAFRELLMNAIEWGGRLDSGRSVRIACLRAKRMLMYRIADPGPGFSLEQLQHAAISNIAGDSLDQKSSSRGWLLQWFRIASPIVSAFSLARPSTIRVNRYL